MTDIRKRPGKRGTSYQVRVDDKGAEKGYSYHTFKTSKEARYFIEEELPNRVNFRHGEVRTVDDAVQKWLEVCAGEGREGRDPVSKSTQVNYSYRAKAIRAYGWTKEIHELNAPDVSAFRAWLLKSFSRDFAKKTLSSFHSVMIEMVAQGILKTDPASSITIQTSRYEEEVKIPSVEETKIILKAADDLAQSQNATIATAWKKYRPMIYLAVETGMRPQEYLAIRSQDCLATGIWVQQALDSSNKVGPTKTRAGKRFIPLAPDVLKLVQSFQRSFSGPNPKGFLFPDKYGKPQRYNNFLRRAWYPLMRKAKMTVEVNKNGRKSVQMLYSPYCLRHFFASMLIAKKRDLKTLQELMGHADAAMTLDVYGHIIRLKAAENISEPVGIISSILANN